jgi:hypothetical protein
MKLATVSQKKKLTLVEKRISHAANILGRTFEEVLTYMMLWIRAAPDRFYTLFSG